MILKPKRANRGLPDHSFLGDEAGFIAAFEACVRDTTLYLGADKVRDIVSEVTRKPRSKQDDLNRKILAAHDTEASVKGKVNKSKLAKGLATTLGKHSDTIRRQLDRLLRERAQFARQCADRAAPKRMLRKLADEGRIDRRGSLLGSDI
jgi:hypothetical protein